MTNLVQFKEKVQVLLNQDSLIYFTGSNLVLCINSLSDSQFEDIYIWLSRVKSRSAKGIKTGKKKRYKQYFTNNLIMFRKKLSINGVAYRILLIKLKNGDFIEFHLSLHEYYDDLRKKLNLGLIF